MVYGIYNELVTGANLNQLISWGPHIAWFSHDFPQDFSLRPSAAPGRSPPRRKALVSWKVKPTEAASDVFG
jgi:hypothetical protein